MVENYILSRKYTAVPAPLVLIVDDEPGLVRLFASLVGRLNCTLLEAESGADAMDILDHETPALMILDLAMPGISGRDVLIHARRISRLDHMKVIILTARPSMVVEVEGLGIDCWIAKPIMPGEFLAIVDEVLYGD